MILRFLLDAQLSRGLGRKLQAQGLDCAHVNSVGLSVATDAAIWAYAKREGRILISKDQDFAALARFDPTGPQVVWLRLGNGTDRLLWEALEPLLPQMTSALMSGERIVEITR